METNKIKDLNNEGWTIEEISKEEQHMDDKSFDALLYEAEVTFRPLNRLNERIHKLEERFNNLDICAPFYFLLEECEVAFGIPEVLKKISWYFYWGRNSTGSYRLHLHATIPCDCEEGDCGGPHIYYQRVFIEESPHRKLQYLKKFDAFVLHFRLLLEFNRNNLSKIVDKNYRYREIIAK